MTNIEQKQLDRLRADLESCFKYVSKPVSLKSMKRVRSEHNLRCLKSLFDDAVRNEENTKVEYLRSLITSLEFSTDTTLKSHKIAISSMLKILDNQKQEIVA
ncbi:hypothetical protein DI392_03625 [Vibrio albus]|uniref:Uncharacterized protein n=1 Tax=Vibrio albus TaxID=2200953 RepID=A0A2U3BBR5_9VIBR|nr:hypothetical protein [Vibrio albus]PWI34218.1 hypothetical protein DI392_03625 [Vibrio albus]